MTSVTDFLDNYCEDMFGVLNRIQEQIDKQFGGYDSFYKSIESHLNQINASFIDCQSIINNALNNFENNLSILNSIEPKVLTVINELYNDIYNDNQYLAVFNNINDFISSIDHNIYEQLSKLSSSEILAQINNLQIAIPHVEQSIEESDVESDKDKQSTVSKHSANDTDETNKTQLTAKNIKLYLEVVCYFITILQFLTSIFFSNASEINISIGNDYSTNYYIAEANNYYINIQEFDATLCNSTGFRFVAEKEIKPRIKADCSSAVVDTLELGKLVQIVDKYEKWVQICWQNDDGTYSYGWIQNYKLAEFK